MENFSGGCMAGSPVHVRWSITVLMSLSILLIYTSLFFPLWIKSTLQRHSPHLHCISAIILWGRLDQWERVADPRPSISFPRQSRNLNQGFPGPNLTFFLLHHAGTSPLPRTQLISYIKRIHWKVSLTVKSVLKTLSFSVHLYARAT